MSRRHPRQRRTRQQPTLWQRIKTHWPTARFILLFGLGVLLVYGLLHQKSINRSVVAPFTESIAACSGFIISLLGASAHVSHRMIAGNNFSIRIENNCNAIFEIGFFLAAVIAYPAAWRGRLWAFVIGPPILYALNLLRVVGLFYIGSQYPQLFDEAHLYVAQSLFVFCIALLWLLWVRRFGARPLELAQILA